jgi:hypothetical protein
VEQTHFWEANSRSATQGIPCPLWTQKVQYCIHKSLPLNHILRQMNSVPPSHPVSLRFIIILSSHLHWFHPRDPFPSGFPTRIVSSCINFVMHTACHAYLIHFDSIILIIFPEASHYAAFFSLLSLVLT